jgi:hypothetical protein
VSDGRWVETELSWHTIAVRACVVCGKLITRRAWVIDHDGESVELCAPECEELLSSYYLPTHATLTSIGEDR